MRTQDLSDTFDCFLKGKASKRYANFHCSGNVIFSYHQPILERNNAGQIRLDNSRYSNTTRKLQNNLKALLKAHNLEATIDNEL